jgi:acetyl-CoA carboxylase biotin carboxylase subunit
MFKKLFIANRGEVAVRVARTARAMGIRVVGAVSSADRGASWTTALDELVGVGSGPPRESYLQQERLVQAAVQTGCTALHPGWGFLAENARFAALVEAHGVTFVGPAPRAMDLMGLKTPAKRAARAAGLPTIPGSDLPIRDEGEALRAAREIGFPVMVKADAGGGGRGMRLVRREADFAAAWHAASSEALAAFGDGACYLEKYVERGRHIEVQVLGDRHGRAVHLWERECSVQRKHQKLVEESCAPCLSDAERERIGALAANLARSIGYAGAGTVEFLRAADGAIYFMEMNTRLQVEHPVTEERLGLDLVRLQLEVAANRPLPDALSSVKPTGHAIEARVNAEDPARGFAPSPGVLSRCEIPLDLGPGRVRLDTHVSAGDEVPPYYDSLLAKVVAVGDTRAQAIATLERCLAAARIEGVATTIPVHLAVLGSAEFRSGVYDTGSIPGWKE